MSDRESRGQLPVTTDAGDFLRLEKEPSGIDPDRGLVWTGVNTRGFPARQRTAHVADNRPIGHLLDLGVLPQQAQLLLVGLDRDRQMVHLDRPIRALIGTQATSDTPVADLDLTTVPPIDGPDRTANHAHWVEAFATGQWDQEILESGAIQIEPRVAVIVSSNTSVDTRSTTRTAIQVDQHQLLSLDEAELFKSGRLLSQRCGIDGHSAGLVLPVTLATADDDFPYACTVYRVVEHEHFVTRNVPLLVEAMPDFFVEIPEGLAAEKGIENGGRARVWSKRGEVEGVAIVTKRIKPLTVNGRTVWTIGIPVHWGFVGITQGSMANLLTPYVGDANTRCPEFKSFLVNVEPV